MVYSKNAILVIVTYDMNVGKWLENELKYHIGYEKIIIFNTCDSTEMNKNIEKFATCYTLKISKIKLTIECLKCILTPKFIKEAKLLYLRRTKHTIFMMFRALVYLATANCYAHKIREKLAGEEIEKEHLLLFYSYWLSIQAETAFYLKSYYTNAKFISRCHRVDIYEEMQKFNYLEYRQALLNCLDGIFCISKHGFNYLNSKYICNNKCRISYLGSRNTADGLRHFSIRNQQLKIVSCSSVTYVKRIDRLIDILSSINNINIVWNHYGDGPLLESIKKKATGLPPNISYQFMGKVEQERLCGLYVQKNYNLFINVSESEGIPVSMMEALSVGIPIIATEVGGVNEIVKNEQNGYILSVDSKNTEFAKCIANIYSMEDSKYQMMQKNCVEIWDKYFNADRNYTNFASSLSMLI